MLWIMLVAMLTGIALNVAILMQLCRRHEAKEPASGKPSKDNAMEPQEHEEQEKERMKQYEQMMNYRPEEEYEK